MIPEARENRKQVALFKWHIRIVLQDGERMYLNVYKSPSASISRSPARLQPSWLRKMKGSAL